MPVGKIPDIALLFWHNCGHVRCNAIRFRLNLYLDGKESQPRIASMFDVSLASVQQWIRNYESMGVDAFTLRGNKKYSKELKQQAVLDYLTERGSQDNI